MIWNSIPDGERLRIWKNLRDEITPLSESEILEKVAIFCATLPFGSRTIDYYSPLEWPTPWEILFHGSFCTSSISLLMYYTLILIPLKSKIELWLVEDDEDVYLLPFVNDECVLNYYLGEVSKYSDIKDKFKVLRKFTQPEIKTIT